LDSKGQEFFEPSLGEYLWSTPVSMSASGRHIVFVTWSMRVDRGLDDPLANPLCTGVGCDVEAYGHYVHDTRSGESDLLNQGATGQTAFAGATSDGRLIAFVSDSPDLVKGDTNRIHDLFVHDRGSDASTVDVHRASKEAARSLGSAGDDRPAGGRLVERRRDLYGVLELDRIDSVTLPRTGISIARPPTTTYAMSFKADDTRYEVRFGPITASDSSTDREPTLYRCTDGVTGCEVVSEIDGSFGKSGPRIVFSVPRRVIDRTGDADIRSVRLHARTI
jgi:hypothetical protein